MARTPWRKTFSSYEAMNKWAEDHDAEIVGTRDLESISRASELCRASALAHEGK